MAGVAIVLPVPLGVGRRLEAISAYRGATMRGAIPPSKMHCTLAYLGKADQFSQENIDDLIFLLGRFFRQWTSVPVVVSGFGRLSGDGDGVSGPDMTVALLDSPLLSGVRERLIREVLGPNGHRLASTHGFLPHVSLVKQNADEATCYDRIPRSAFQFKKASLWLAGKSIKIPFRKASR